MTFTAPSVSGYNASPPPDDGTEDSTNEISWDKHKTKIGDPLKTCLEALMTELDRWITDDAQTDLVVAADLLTKLKTVDGSGSGLDADLLDGVSSAGFCQTANNLSDVTAATAFGNIKQAASTAATGVVELATAAEMVTATDTGRVPSVSVVKDHPGVAKAWCRCASDGTISASYNITSVSQGASGTYTVTIATDMADGNYAAVATPDGSGSTERKAVTSSLAAGSLVVTTLNAAGSNASAAFSLVIFGTSS